MYTMSWLGVTRRKMRKDRLWGAAATASLALASKFRPLCRNPNRAQPALTPSYPC